METKKISICVCTYNRMDFIVRLLDSISIQSYQNFEVIVTDNSTNEYVQNFFSNHKYSYSIIYIRHVPPIAPTENWTSGIKHASGDWIKLMFDDDWFSHENSLAMYAKAINNDTECVFSGYISYDEDAKTELNKTITQERFCQIKQNPYLLFAKNEIGCPSVMFFNKKMTTLFDLRIKWIVDFEAYIRIILLHKCVYINEPLIKMSYNDSQLTKSCFGNVELEVYEALVFFSNHKYNAIKHWLVYDAWWRLIRNLNISSTDTLYKYSKGLEVPIFLIRIVKQQRLIPKQVLRVRVFSKLLMLASFVLFKLRLRQ